MSIELNFESPNKCGASALCVFMPADVNFEFRIDKSSYNGPDGEVNVEVCVARLSANTSVNAAIGLAYELADFLKEDCIAVSFNEVSGMLVGPNAAKWGDFNRDFFIPF